MTPGTASARRHGLLLLLACAAAAFSVVVHQLLFRRGSVDNDEVGYLLQARAIASGHLFLPLRQPAEAYQPWFFVVRDVGMVSKYLPLVSAMLALGLRLTGSIVPVLAVLAALVPLLVAGLAQELGFDRRGQLLAAALVALSPVVLMDSALPLSYLPFLVLVTASWLLVVRLGTGRGGWRSAVLLGLFGSAAACARPYDAVLLLAPGVLWIVVRRRKQLLRLAGSVLLGGLPLAVTVALYDARATGVPWRAPFGLLEPSDAIGFGVRRLIPENPPRSFGLPQALHGLWLHFGVAPLTWFALAALLMPAAVLAWRRPATPEPVRVLLATVVVHVFGYAVFWGPWNVSVLWGAGVPVLGPFYALPLTVPLVLAGLPVLRGWWASMRPLRPLVAVAAVVAVLQLAYALTNAAEDRSRTDEVLSVAAQGQQRGELLLDVQPPYLGHPVSAIVDNAVLSAWAPVPPAGVPARDLLQLPDGVYGPPTLSYALSRTERLAGPTVPLAVTLMGRPSDVLVVERNGHPTACRSRDEARVVVTPTGTRGCAGQLVPDVWSRQTEQRCPDLSCVVLVLYRADDRGNMRDVALRRLPVDTTRNGVALLAEAGQIQARGFGWVRVAPGDGVSPAAY